MDRQASEAGVGAQSLLADAFELKLLGGFELRGPDGRSLELPTRKCELLLAYLAMPAGQAHSRDKLAGLFWGDREDEQARGSLRKALSALRAALGKATIEVDRDSIALTPDAVSVDAERLASLAADVDRAEKGPSDGLAYGEFLEGRSLSSPEFSDWQSFERTRCRNHAQTVLGSIAERLASERKQGEALTVARRLLALDALREESHRLLMRLYAAAGERSMALSQFNACKDLLWKELSVAPSPETLRLAQEIASQSDRQAGSLPQPGSDPRESGWLTEQHHDLSIAVLPFANKSGDPEQDHVADGLSEDLITELSRQKEFLVIARQSSFQFASNPQGAAAAAQQLGVRYALTGSMRAAGGRLRVNAQLIDGAGDRCVWAERYDRRIEEFFDVQDEVVAQIIASIDAQVRLAERERAARKRPESLDAWELFHRGMWHIYRFTSLDTTSAEACFRKALGLAPGFALPHAGLGYALYVKVTWHYVDNAKAAIVSGIRHAEAALALDETDAFTHVVLGRLLTLAGEMPRAVRHLTEALEINPNFAQAHFGMAQALFWTGKPDPALQYVDRALRLSPKDPLACLFMVLRSFCHYWLGDLVAAEAAARRATELQGRETWSRLALAVVLKERGRDEDAAVVIAEARKIDPFLTISSFDAVVGHVPKLIRDRVYARLRSAGLEDG